MARLYMDERELRAVGLSEPMIRTLRKLAEFVETQEELAAAQAAIVVNGDAIDAANTDITAANSAINALDLRIDAYDALAPFVRQSGALDLNIRTITATATPAADDYTLLCDATSGAITVNLPAAASNAGRVLLVKKIDASANAITLDGDGAETIDGSATQSTTTQWASFSVQCNGSGWFII